MDTISTADELEALIGLPLERVRKKVRTALSEFDRQWLAASPFCVLSTTDANGRVDASPKGDPAGFIHVLDEHTIAIPERPGNKLAFGFHNILENPNVGVLSVVPGRTDTLRINGTARIVRDADFFDQMVVRGTGRVPPSWFRWRKCSRTAARPSCAAACGNRKRGNPKTFLASRCSPRRTPSRRRRWKISRPTTGRPMRSGCTGSSRESVLGLHHQATARCAVNERKTQLASGLCSERFAHWCG